MCSRYVEEQGPNYFTREELGKFLNGWTDDKNERFLSYIRSRWLVAPSHGPLNISHKYEHVVDFSQEGQSTFVDEVNLSLIGDSNVFLIGLSSITKLKSYLYTVHLHWRKQYMDKKKIILIWDVSVKCFQIC